MVTLRERAVRAVPAARALRRIPTVTGRLVDGLSGAALVEYHRAFRMSPEQVWAWLSERDLASQWLGTWREGYDGRALFRFSPDGAEAPEFAYRIEAVDPARSVTMSLRNEDDRPEWRLEVTLQPSGDGGTLVTLRQSMTDAVLAPSIGATCEFLLDRLVLAAHGLDPRVLDYDEYFLAQAPGYRQMFPLQRDGFALELAQRA